MGSRVQKIAFLIFALMFVAIMAVLNTSILTLGTSANDQLTTVVASDDSTLSVYDDTTVYGTTVLNCAKAPNSVYSNPLTVTVVTAADDTQTDYTGDSYYGMDESPAPSDPEYINRNAKFESQLHYNDNGIVDQIIFVQEGATAE